MKNALNRFLLLALLSCPALTALAQNAREATAEPNTDAAPQATDKTNGKAPQNNPARATIDPIGVHRRLLSEELADEALTWLDAQGEKFIALWEPDNSGNSYGAVLILHGAGQTPDWPDTINPLRTSLIQFGWSTLAIELPDPDPENSTEALAQARIRAAVEFLDQQGQYNLALVGKGSGADRGMEFIKAQPARERPGKKEEDAMSTRGPFRALIMISARRVKIERDFRLPTLDLYYGEHFLDSTEVRERHTSAKKYRLPHYHQIPLLRPDETAYGEANRLTRRVRGFLNKYAKGVEVKR